MGGAVGDVEEVQKLLALTAPAAHHGTLEFQDVFAPCLLVDAVDVHCEDGFQLARLFQPG